MNVRLILGKCEDHLKGLDAASLDALACDPPSGISFMGEAWDSDKGGRDHWIAWLAEIMHQAVAALKPGAHGVVWALPRTSHWTAMALENAGFEIRDVIMHVFGQGFPKSRNLPVAIDKAAGAIGSRGAAFSVAGDVRHLQSMEGVAGEHGEHEGITSAAQRWHGWGTALKPASEHWILVRKLLVGTVAENVQRYGTGAINVEACRVGTTKDVPASMPGDRPRTHAKGAESGRVMGEGQDPNVGRWPPHLLLSHSPDCAERCVEDCPVRVLDEQSGYLKTGRVASHSEAVASSGFGSGADVDYADGEHGGGASRFFPRFRYQAKASASERHAGCEGFFWRRSGQRFELVSEEVWRTLAPSERAQGNIHPTLKSLELLRWLVRLITPPGGTVLDPFMGSGTTGCACALEGFGFVGIEEDPGYAELARARIEHWGSLRLDVENSTQERPEKRQQTLF
jgi:site-specific DNA-methyltransferase (adenine-specific)